MASLHSLDTQSFEDADTRCVLVCHDVEWCDLKTLDETKMQTFLATTAAFSLAVAILNYVGDWVLRSTLRKAKQAAEYGTGEGM